MSKKTYPETEVMLKQEFCDENFPVLFPDEVERRNRQAVLDEVKEQLEYCEYMCCPVTYLQLKEWLQCNNVYAVQRKAHTQKGFS